MDSKQNAEYPEWNWGDVSGADDDGLFKNDDTNFKADCDCPGLPSPPKFALPPPPVPFSASNCPFHNGDGYYSPANGGTNGHFDANGLSDLEYCDIQVLEGPYTQTAIPSIAVIVVVSFFTLVVILVASLLFWK